MPPKKKRKLENVQRITLQDVSGSGDFERNLLAKFDQADAQQQVLKLMTDHSHVRLRCCQLLLRVYKVRGILPVLRDFILQQQDWASSKEMIKLCCCVNEPFGEKIQNCQNLFELLGDNEHAQQQVFHYTSKYLASSFNLSNNLDKYLDFANTHIQKHIDWIATVSRCLSQSIAQTSNSRMATVFGWYSLVCNDEINLCYWMRCVSCLLKGVNIQEGTKSVKRAMKYLSNHVNPKYNAIRTIMYHIVIDHINVTDVVNEFHSLFASCLFNYLRIGEKETLVLKMPNKSPWEFHIFVKIHEIRTQASKNPLLNASFESLLNAPFQSSNLHDIGIALALQFDRLGNENIAQIDNQQLYFLQQTVMLPQIPGEFVFGYCQAAIHYETLLTSAFCFTGLTLLKQNYKSAIKMEVLYVYN